MVFSPDLCACLCDVPVCAATAAGRRTQTGYSEKIILTDINYMPPVIFFACLDLDYKSTDSSIRKEGKLNNSGLCCRIVLID